MGRKCCDDGFSLMESAKCTDCPYLTQCTDNKKEDIKENFEEKNDTDKKRTIDNGDDL